MAHGADSHTAHQFDHPEQQRQASLLGIWLFLITEVMFFGGVFTAYAIYRFKYPDAWRVGSHLLSVSWGGLNTVLLITSSLTMTLAVRAATRGARAAISLWLAATIALGAVFLGVKVMEYGAKADHRLVPGPAFDSTLAYARTQEHEKEGFEGALQRTFGERTTARFEKSLAAAQPRHVELFFSFYFVMTGLHGIHMVVGVAILLVMLRGALRGRFTPAYHTPLEVSGLYWHFVDIVWIFLFPMLYLIGRI